MRFLNCNIFWRNLHCITYHLSALLRELSSAPYLAAHRAADRLMLCVVNSLPKRVFNI